MRARSRGITHPICAVVVASVLSLPTNALSQEAPQPIGFLTVGSRVRLEAPTMKAGRLEGTVTELDKVTLVVSQHDRIPLRVPRQAIASLEVYAGQRRAAPKPMLIGAGIGMSVFALGSGLACFEGCSQSEHESALAALLLVGGIVGAGVGALIKQDRWSAVPLDRVRMSLGTTRGRGVALSLSLGF